MQFSSEHFVQKRIFHCLSGQPSTIRDIFSPSLAFVQGSAHSEPRVFLFLCPPYFSCIKNSCCSHAEGRASRIYRRDQEGGTYVIAQRCIPPVKIIYHKPRIRIAYHTQYQRYCCNCALDQENANTNISRNTSCIEPARRRIPAGVHNSCRSCAANTNCHERMAVSAARIPGYPPLHRCFYVTIRINRTVVRPRRCRPGCASGQSRTSHVLRVRGNSEQG